MRRQGDPGIDQLVFPTDIAYTGRNHRLNLGIVAGACMRYESLFLALTAGLINCDHSQFEKALLILEESFEGLEFRQQRVPGHSSIGARTLSAQNLTLYDWIHDLRRHGVLRAGTPGLVPTSPKASISKMQADAFTGGNLRSLVVEFATGQTLYAMQTENSSPHMMSAHEFEDWISAQPSSEAIWARILNELNDFNQMSGFELVLPEQVQAYFSSAIGAHIFQVLGDRCLEAAQMAAVGAGHDLVVKESEQAFFDRGDREQQLHELLGGKAEEFLPFEELLQLLGVVQGAELVELFDAQDCRQDVWKQVTESLIGIGELEATAGEREARFTLQALPPQKIEFFANSLVTRMQNACRAKRVAVKIPAHFDGRLMTHFESLSAEDKESYVPTEMRLHFTPNREPWQHFAFTEIGDYKDKLSSDLEQTIARMQKVLRQAYAFATRVESKCAQSFGLANMLLSQEGAPLFKSAEGFELLKPLLTKQGYAEDVQRLLEEDARVIFVLKELGYTSTQLSALCATSMADVFGGMGTWNDMYFEDPADQKEYEELSDALFESLQALQSDALSAVGEVT